MEIDLGWTESVLRSLHVQDIRNIVERIVIGAPLNAVDKPVVSLLEHPLIRLARELYAARPRC